MPTSIKSEIPVFAVDNSADVEQYLFVNHPTEFISLTSDAKDEHHSTPASPKTELKPILKPFVPQQQQHVTFAAPAPTHPIAPKMERQSSTASTVSTASDADSEGFLGGGALRHISGSHHLRELAELAELDAQAKAKRQACHAPANQAAVRKPTADEGWLAMAWWPESMEMMEHEWTDDFYE